MTTLADRFRRWYDHERDCNAKSLSMLASVPEERRSEPEFQKAIDKMAHLVAARRRWLCRLTDRPGPPHTFPKGTTLDELPGLVAGVEADWVGYLAGLDDPDLAREIEWTFDDGRRFRWTVEGVLTQTSGHAWYHRGQIAQLVAILGGRHIDTDYIFWSDLKPIEGADA